MKVTSPGAVASSTIVVVGEEGGTAEDEDIVVAAAPAVTVVAVGEGRAIHLGCEAATSASSTRGVSGRYRPRTPT